MTTNSIALEAAHTDTVTAANRAASVAILALALRQLQTIRARIRRDEDLSAPINTTAPSYAVHIDWLRVERALVARGIDAKKVGAAVQLLSNAMTAFDAWTFAGRQIADAMNAALAQIRQALHAGQTPDMESAHASSTVLRQSAEALGEVTRLLQATSGASAGSGRRRAHARQAPGRAPRGWHRSN